MRPLTVCQSALASVLFPLNLGSSLAWHTHGQSLIITNYRGLVQGLGLH